MCIAIPGKVIEVRKNTSTVDFNGNLIEAASGLTDVRVGDRVLVHAGCIIQKLSEEDLSYMSEFFEELEKMEDF